MAVIAAFIALFEATVIVMLNTEIGRCPDGRLFVVDGSCPCVLTTHHVA